MTIQRMSHAAMSLVSAFVMLAAYADETKPKIYDESGKGLLEIMHATTKAKAESKRVLIQFGGNRCGWCVRLHDLCQKDSTLSATLSKRFVVAYVDSQTNQRTMKMYAPDVEGVPYLVVLDSDGNVLVTQSTDVFEVGSVHDPKKLNAWFEEWGTKPVDAKAVLSTAQAHAAKSDKRVFLTFGSPSCGWCRKLEAILHSDTVAPIMAKDFIIAKVDLGTMQNAKDVEATYRKAQPAAPSADGNMIISGGIPWFAMLDANGRVLATTDKPGYGNIGCPAKDEEIAWFTQMLSKSATRITDQEKELLAKIFKEETKPKK